MTIAELVALTRRVHDTEGHHLGSRSTRDTRNAFIERVIGIAHWGHPTYNPNPDPRWNCKDPDGQGGRPMSDDVAVLMPQRLAFDLVTAAGADGYRIEAGEAFELPMDQWVFAPSKPAAPETPTPAPLPASAPTPPPPPPADLLPVLERLDTLLSQSVTLSHDVDALGLKLEEPHHEVAGAPIYVGKLFGVTVTLRPVKGA